MIGTLAFGFMLAMGITCWVVVMYIGYLLFKYASKPKHTYDKNNIRKAIEEHIEELHIKEDYLEIPKFKGYLEDIKNGNFENLERDYDIISTQSVKMETNGEIGLYTNYTLSPKEMKKENEKKNFFKNPFTRK